jgi:hypothetical protein
MPGGQVVREMPAGEATVKTPSSVITNNQPGEWVFSR